MGTTQSSPEAIASAHLAVHGRKIDLPTPQQSSSEGKESGKSDLSSRLRRSLNLSSSEGSSSHRLTLSGYASLQTSVSQLALPPSLLPWFISTATTQPVSSLPPISTSALSSKNSSQTIENLYEAGSLSHGQLTEILRLLNSSAQASSPPSDPTLPIPQTLPLRVFDPAESSKDSSVSTKMFDAGSASDGTVPLRSQLHTSLASLVVEGTTTMDSLIHAPNGAWLKVFASISSSTFIRWLVAILAVDSDDKASVSGASLKTTLLLLAFDGIHPSAFVFEPQSEASPPWSSLVIREYGGPDATCLSLSQAAAFAADVWTELANLGLDSVVAASRSTAPSSVGSVRLSKSLGKGAVGVVRYGTSIESGDSVAVKLLPRGDASQLSRIDVEIRANASLHHPSIAQLQEVLSTPDHIMLVFECAEGGSIVPLLPLPPPVAAGVWLQLVSAVKHAHAVGVVHRDLRVDNIMLGDGGMVKLIDFGQAGIFENGWDLFQTLLVGSLYHMAPEQIAAKAYSGIKLDVWSLGLILFHLLTGHSPWSHLENGDQFVDAINAAAFSLPPPFDQDAQLLDLLKNHALVVDPEKRSDTRRLLNHPWSKSWFSHWAQSGGVARVFDARRARTGTLNAETSRAAAIAALEAALGSCVADGSTVVSRHETTSTGEVVWKATNRSKGCKWTVSLKTTPASTTATTTPSTSSPAPPNPPSSSSSSSPPVSPPIPPPPGSSSSPPTSPTVHVQLISGPVSHFWKVWSRVESHLSDHWSWSGSQVD